MTTDKPKWWQSWMVYALIGLLLTLGPYVGGYFLLGRYDSVPESPFDTSPVTVRQFDYQILGIVFGPLGWAEAKVRGVRVSLFTPGESDLYEPSW
ncbi:hypothetical protein Mal52_22550 [Symmachiella dynata]|uniref:Uncharacterized protein n=1 Tax=Symmachiella dynata TaxID=2527995 RepID=A0A517ZMS4_9PLAN|nr:hypothetical protein [Symmachiella dynata]QDU43779.1 hypothetical protein Mal52_22550 [Symmachiella dynata]